MRKSASQRKREDAIKSRLGKHVETLIKEAGYSGPYDFWVNTAGDSNEVSRDTLNKIIKGNSNASAVTLIKLAKLLKVAPSRMLDF
jgi:plasmid maintenance system antidote protein VapI